MNTFEKIATTVHNKNDIKLMQKIESIKSIPSSIAFYLSFIKKKSCLW